jgi:hydroxypyruvate reductase
MNRSAGTLLRALLRAALAAVDARRATASALSRRDVARVLRGARRVGIFACGKAATGMFEAAWRPGRDALVVLPLGYPAPRRRPGSRVLFAAHPEPDEASVEAARAAVAFFARFGRDDVVLCLVSGGSSSLLCLPRRGLTLARKKREVRRLVESGASIVEVNRLRTSLSAIKGGKLGRATAARIVTLVVSDVPGDVPSRVGSGPTIRRRAGDLTRVVASNRDGLTGAAREARRLGLRPRTRRSRLAGEAAAAARLMVAAVRRLPAGEARHAGGETTVALGRRRGRGGRNLEAALAAALALDGLPGAAMLFAASDGKDGSSNAAGALVDGETAGRARNLGLDARRALLFHDTGRFFERAGGLVVTGPTGTNVADWAFGVRGYPAGSGERKTRNGKGSN